MTAFWLNKGLFRTFKHTLIRLFHGDIRQQAWQLAVEVGIYVRKYLLFGSPAFPLMSLYIFVLTLRKSASRFCKGAAHTRDVTPSSAKNAVERCIFFGDRKRRASDLQRGRFYGEHIKPWQQLGRRQESRRLKDKRWM